MGRDRCGCRDDVCCAGVALAGAEDPALLKFKLDNSSQYDDFENARVRDGSRRRERRGRRHHRQRLGQRRGARDRSRARLRERRRRAQQGELRRDPRGEPASKQAEIDAKKALDDNAAGKKGASAAPGSVRAQRADYYENNVGKFISIEANADGVTYTGANGNIYNGPTLMAEWYDAAGNKLGEGAAATTTPTPTSPGLLPVPLGVFRNGNKGDSTPRPPRSRSPPTTATSTRWPPRNGSRRTRRRLGRASSRASSTATTTRRTRSRRSGTSPPSSRTSRRSPSCRRRRTATSARPRRCSATEQRPRTPNRAERDHAVRPLRRQQPARSPARRRPTAQDPEHGRRHLEGHGPPRRQLADGADRPADGHEPGALRHAHGQRAARDTCAQRQRRGHQHRQRGDRGHQRAPGREPASSARPSTARCDAGTGIVAAERRVAAQRPAARAGDGPARPADPVRAAHRQGSATASKVGVYLYCQEHAGEIATSGVCLETAERLVRNYGTDPQTTALVDGLEIFIVPQINSDGVNHSIYDSPRRTNMAPYCYDPASPPRTSATRPTATTTASTSTATSASARSSTASRAPAPAARAATPPACSSSPSPRRATRSGSRRRSATSSSRTTSTRPVATSCGRPAPTRPGRVPLPYPPYGTLNFFDQAASTCSTASSPTAARRSARSGPAR